MMMERYVSAKDKSSLAQKIAQDLTDAGEMLHPATAHGKKIATSFWGYAWCRSIEQWQDYESRLPAGRSLLRNCAVIDLTIEPGLIKAKVVHKELFELQIFIDEPEEERLTAVRNRCAGKITSLLDLLQDNLTEDILAVLGDPENGLFPEYGQIRASCNCIDDACLCSHAAAALYGVGAMLDDDPALLFRLRGIDMETFFDTGTTADSLADDVDFSTDNLSEMFGIHLDNGTR